MTLEEIAKAAAEECCDPFNVWYDKHVRKLSAIIARHFRPMADELDRMHRDGPCIEVKKWTRERTEELREHAVMMNNDGYGHPKLIRDAADAIEELAMQLHFELTSNAGHNREPGKIVCNIAEIIP